MVAPAAERRFELASRNSAEAPGNSDSYGPGSSNDGRYVTYFSTATNMAPGSPGTSNGVGFYFRDRAAGTTERLLVDYERATGGMSGRYVAGRHSVRAFL